MYMYTLILCIYIYVYMCITYYLDLSQKVGYLKIGAWETMVIKHDDSTWASCLWLSQVLHGAVFFDIYPQKSPKRG